MDIGGGGGGRGSTSGAACLMDESFDIWLPAKAMLLTSPKRATLCWKVCQTIEGLKLPCT